MPMKTLNLGATMKTQNHRSADGLVLVARVSQPAVSPTSKSAGWEKLRVHQAGRAPAGLETRDTADWEVCATSQPAAALLLLLLCLAWLALPGTAFGQPNYTNATEVASYVKQMLYWPDAYGTDRNLAAFRYKHLLYVNAGGIRPDLTNMASLYGVAERTRSQTAEAELKRGLTNNPASAVLGDLLLDLYYDRTVAEAIFAREAVEKAERAHFGPPIASPAPPDRFIIYNEIAAYEQALQSNRLALATYFALLTNSLGVADVAATPLGYRIFQERVPGRGLEPAAYVSNSVVVSVTADTSALFSGYKDLVLLYELLSDQGRTAATLARLRFLRNGAGDVSAAESLIAEAQRSLGLHAHALRTAFPSLNLNDASLTDSGVGAALAGVSDSLAELERVKVAQRSRLNPLGFEPDFLVLVQGAFAGEQPRADTYDAFLVHLANSNSTRGLAINALADARSSYATVRESEDELAGHFDNSSITYMDRLRDIVGVFPDDPTYSAFPQGAPGSELNLQFLSISNAVLSITNISVQMDNVYAKVAIELRRSNSVTTAYISYGNQRAKLVDEISKLKATQAAANAIASGISDAAGSFGASIGAQCANAAVQASMEFVIGDKEETLEKLAAQQNAKIEGINSAAQVKTWMLELNTLAVDLLSAQVKLRQEVNLLVSLYREKADLERVLKEKDSNLTRRYFADPVHRLILQADMIQAELAFAEAQKWLFFMARALEYKWNKPLDALLGGWQMADLFKLRNADELQDMYAAMKLFDDEQVMSSTSDDRFDWFSVREQFLGYTRTNELGQAASYVDPATGQTNDALGAFRLHLSRLVVNGWIELDFNTVREIENKSFFRGPTYFPNGNVDPTKPGSYLDKIQWVKLRLPGGHVQEPVVGYLRYGGTSYLRNPEYGTRDPLRSDRIIDEMTAYSTRHWKKVSGKWIFTEGINAEISMLKVPRAEPRLDGNPASPDVLPSVNKIEVFRERSVATTGWHLSIPVTGAGSVTITNLDDIEIYFYHWSYNR